MSLRLPDPFRRSEASTMKQQAAIILLSLPIAAMVVGAQSEVDQPLPEVTTLVQRAVLQQRLAAVARF